MSKTPNEISVVEEAYFKNLDDLKMYEMIISRVFKALGVYTITEALIKIVKLTALFSVAHVIKKEIQESVRKNEIPVVDSAGTVMLFVDAGLLKSLCKLVEELEEK